MKVVLSIIPSTYLYLLFCLVLFKLPAALNLNAADAAKLIGKTTANALPLIEEVSAGITYTWNDSETGGFFVFLLLKNDSSLLWYFQVARLQNSTAFKAASSLDFQGDLIGSINMFLCGKQPDSNSTNMTLGLLSPRQMANKTSISITGNSSGKCCSKLLYKAKLSHRTFVLIIYLHFSSTAR